MMALFNARGLDVVEKVNIVMAYIVTVRRAPFVVVASCVTHLGWRCAQLPMFVLLFYLTAEGNLDWAKSAAPVPDNVDWGLFINTIVWYAMRESGGPGELWLTHSCLG